MNLASKFPASFQRIRVGPIRKLRLAPCLDRATPAQAIRHLNEMLRDELACAVFERWTS